MSKAKRRNRGRERPGSGFVQLPNWMLDCAAYMALSPIARALLIELKRLYRGDNNGELHLGARKAAAALGVNKDTVGKPFRELCEKGFIRPHVAAAFDWKAGAGTATATTWILTEYEFAGRAATRDFMKWREPNSKTRSEIFAGAVRKNRTVNAAAALDCPKKPDTLELEPRSSGPDNSDTYNLPGRVLVA